MSVSFSPALAGIREFRETFLELVSPSNITDIRRTISVEKVVIQHADITFLLKVQKSKWLEMQDTIPNPWV